MDSGSAVEVDPAVFENSDDAYSSTGYETSTTSLTSSINAYVYENGRKYHSYFGRDKYLLATDEAEQDRLDIHHECNLILYERRLHCAPIGDNPQHILDLGTGTGIWAVDMADKYPSAEVIGVDLSPIQPQWVPPNCRFEVDDVEAHWTHKPDQFDYIHIRHLVHSIKDWPKLLGDCFKTIEPGGWIEVQELEFESHCDDGSMTEDNGVKIFNEKLNEGLALLGRASTNAHSLETDLKDAGFVNTRIVKRRQPLGPWPKDPHYKQAGAMSCLAAQTGYHSYGMALFTRVMGMPNEEADRICRNAVKAIENKNQHVWIWACCVYGQKPKDSA